MRITTVSTGLLACATRRYRAGMLCLPSQRGRAKQELRKVARDAYVSWQGSRYSAPWKYAGKEVWVLESGCDVEVRHGGDRIAMHGQAERRHQVITRREHHEGIPLGTNHSGKTLIHIQQAAPVVQVRSLEAYESVGMGGAQ